MSIRVQMDSEVYYKCDHVVDSVYDPITLSTAPFAAHNINAWFRSYLVRLTLYQYRIAQLRKIRVGTIHLPLWNFFISLCTCKRWGVIIKTVGCGGGKIYWERSIISCSQWRRTHRNSLSKLQVLLLAYVYPCTRDSVDSISEQWYMYFKPMRPTQDDLHNVGYLCLCISITTYCKLYDVQIYTPY